LDFSDNKGFHVLLQRSSIIRPHAIRIG